MSFRRGRTLLEVALLTVSLCACAGGGAGYAEDTPGVGADTGALAGDTSDGEVPTATPEDLDMATADFGCMLDFPQVGRFRITNLLGHEAEALAVAASPDGGVYPVGTLIQLVPFEAMVKRRAGYSATSRDWEFFSLDTTGPTAVILDRGDSGVVNQFGGDCLSCHIKADVKWDMVCQQGHGCDDLPLTPAAIKLFQNDDGRCP
ncbi:MAG: hypothetical protein R3F39_11075 [Myxococcota bacterium]